MSVSSWGLVPSLPLLALARLQGAPRTGGPGQLGTQQKFPPSSLSSSAGTTGPSAEQMPRTCSGCAKRPATWCATVRPARMTSPCPSSEWGGLTALVGLTCQDGTQDNQREDSRRDKRRLQYSPHTRPCWGEPHLSRTLADLGPGPEAPERSELSPCSRSSEFLGGNN